MKISEHKNHNGVSNMNIPELTVNSSKELKQKFINAFLEIWNSGDSLKFLSFSGQRFTHSQISGWVNDLSESCPIRYLFVEENEEILGIAVIKLDFLDGFELFGLGVNPAKRCKGIGSALIKQCCEYALKNSFVSIKTTVFADNLRMQRLLMKNEFYPVSMEHGKRYDGMTVINYMKQLR